MTWTHITPTQWVRDDGTGADQAVSVVKVGPYFNTPAAVFRVSGNNYGEPTDHATLDEAIAAADERLPPSDHS